ncbi:hypothetical protein ACFXTH_021823 [Malus domestica]
MAQREPRRQLGVGTECACTRARALKSCRALAPRLREAHAPGKQPSFLLSLFWADPEPSSGWVPVKLRGWTWLTGAGLVFVLGPGQSPLRWNCS